MVDEFSMFEEMKNACLTKDEYEKHLNASSTELKKNFTQR